jgi:hypothetical protein
MWLRKEADPALRESGVQDSYGWKWGLFVDMEGEHQIASSLHQLLSVLLVWGVFGRVASFSDLILQTE